MLGSLDIGGATYDVFLVYKDNNGNLVEIPADFDYNAFEKTKEYSLDMLKLLSDFHEHQKPKNLEISLLDEQGAHLSSDALQSHELPLDRQTAEKAQRAFAKQYPQERSSRFQTAKDIYKAAIKPYQSISSVQNFSPRNPQDLSVTVNSKITPNDPLAPALQANKKDPIHPPPAPERKSETPENSSPTYSQQSAPPAVSSDEKKEDEQKKLKKDLEKRPEEFWINLHQAWKNNTLDEEQENALEGLRDFFKEKNPQISQEELNTNLEAFFTTIEWDRFWDPYLASNSQ
ncbi:MAG: hypothetical protein Tsb0015_16120 [Simkaniaceae bacterium]